MTDHGPEGTREAGAAAVEALAQAGVRRFYTVPGESFLPVLAAVERDPALTLVSARHESGAAFMAEADAALTGHPAVAMATRGVGAGNLSIGLQTAYEGSTPLIALLGQVETDHLGKGAFQEVNLEAFLGPITKWVTTVHRGDRVAELVGRAYEIAVSGRPGPVAVALPADVLFTQVAAPLPIYGQAGRAGRPVAAESDVDELAKRLRAARSPVLVVGSGARGCHDPLIEVAEGYGLGVYTAFRRQDTFPNDHPHYLGHLGLGGGPTTRALREADLVVLVGNRLDEITSQGYSLPGAETDVVQVDVEPGPLGSPGRPVQRLTADVPSTLAALARRVGAAASASRDWTSARATYTKSVRIPDAEQRTGVHPARAVAALRRRLPADTIVTNDAGNFAAFLQRHWGFSHPRTQLGPVNGAMGYAVPAGVAAALAEPDRHVLAAAGDGGFLMTGMEVETAVRLGVDLTVAVFRNGLYGTIAMHQAMTYGELAAVDIGEVDVAAIARGLGARAFTVRDEAALDAALDSLSTTPSGVTVLDIVTDPDLIAPGARLSTDLH
ncbi:thiamine pyrophosphate-binding protein [Spiractinospora alimapuensis]|uniref:thiamine pyrophosphate-dependent enzyme n=1 Tax=Spiractinospora alimapuensis TaxID=2820884 RepID=UPI001F1A1AFF|nr:thiamine pyrophosphate-dependent enzyme [Spiractinospora alimapuensis]QVQ53043.1 thiamine pyrophosphate-binding protein [Spiractinospora alimapuensis]